MRHPWTHEGATVDGEREVVIATATKAFCEANGILIRERAADQRARIIERRGALLRISFHRSDAQLKLEGINVPFSQRLSEYVFGGNATVSLNGATSFNAVYGRTPLILPGMEVLNSDQMIG